MFIKCTTDIESIIVLFHCLELFGFVSQQRTKNILDCVFKCNHRYINIIIIICGISEVNTITPFS